MRKKDDKKEFMIFNAALRLILQEGLAGLTMAKLAKEAGVATGTLYVYFKNKEELISALYAHTRTASNHRFLKGYDENAPFRIGLKVIWVNYLQHRIEHFKESIFMEQYYRSPFITEEHRRNAEAMKEPIYEVIRKGKREMLVKQDVDEEMLFVAMLGFIRELADEHVAGRYTVDEECIDKAFQMSWDMIKL